MRLCEYHLVCDDVDDYCYDKYKIKERCFNYKRFRKKDADVYKLIKEKGGKIENGI